jgi:hypothetical protein
LAILPRGVRKAFNDVRNKLKIPLSGAALGRGYEASIGHMQPGFREHLAALIKAGHEAGHDLSVFSGWRSQAEQDILHARSPRMTAVHSHHTAGTAADLKGDLDWAHAHAAEYGLDFPMYPRGRKSIYEPWHVEPLKGLDANARQHTSMNHKVSGQLTRLFPRDRSSSLGSRM